MTKIIYDVPLIKQGVSECVQASTAKLLQFYGLNKSFEEVKKEVPVYKDKNGELLGTPLPDIATYFINQGFKVFLHLVDVQIFDRSWKSLPADKLIENLLKRKEYISHPIYSKEIIEMIINGYINFLKSGGSIKFPIIDENYIQDLLKNGPVFGVLNYNLLNDVSKYKFDTELNDWVKDDIRGETTTHAVVIAGYEDDKFLIIDPDLEFGGKRWIESNRLIASLYLSDSDYDCLLISLST